MKESMSENEQIGGNSKPADDKQKNGKGVADRPHLWTVVLALGALVVSIGSFIMSYLAYNLNKQSTRPILEVSKLEFLEDWRFDPRKHLQQSPISVLLTIENKGKILLPDTDVRLAPSLCYESKNIDSLTGAHLKSCVSAGGESHVLVKELGPSASREYRVLIQTNNLYVATTSPMDYQGKISDINLEVIYGDSNGSHNPCFTSRANSDGFLLKGIVYPCNLLKGRVSASKGNLAEP